MCTYLPQTHDEKDHTNLENLFCNSKIILNYLGESQEGPYKEKLSGHKTKLGGGGTCL